MTLITAKGERSVYIGSELVFWQRYNIDIA